MENIAELVGPHAAGLIDPRLLIAAAVVTLVLASGIAARVIEGIETAQSAARHRHQYSDDSKAPSPRAPATTVAL